MKHRQKKLIKISGDQVIEKELPELTDSSLFDKR